MLFLYLDKFNKQGRFAAFSQKAETPIWSISNQWPYPHPYTEIKHCISVMHEAQLETFSYKLLVLFAFIWVMNKVNRTPQTSVVVATSQSTQMASQ